MTYTLSVTIKYSDMKEDMKDSSPGSLHSGFSCLGAAKPVGHMKYSSIAVRKI